MSAPGVDATHVVAAVLIDDRGRVLISERPAGKHMAGFWEFPGGKLARGESGEQALARELAEELGITVAPGACRPLLRLRHAYPDRVIELEAFVVERWDGRSAGLTGRGLEGQALRWVAPEALAAEALLPADGPIVAALVAGSVPA